MTHNQATPLAMTCNQLEDASLVMTNNQYTTVSQDASATSFRNQVVAAVSHNQQTASSQSHTSNTSSSSHRLAIALGSDTVANRSTSHHGRINRSDQLVHNDDTNSGNESDEEPDDGDNPIPPQVRAKRNSKKARGDLHPHHLGFYSGTWYDVLVEAKNRYRLFIHTLCPFPDRNSNSLRDAHDCLLETITKYKDEGAQLDDGDVNNQLQTYTVTNNI
jgi:hypothetical protein